MRSTAASGVPPRRIGVGSPRRRLNSRAVRPGSERLRRTAASPVISVPSARRCTTLGITWLCVPNATISAEPLGHTAAAV